MSADGELVHASSVLIDGRVLLIGGRSGAGKSDLALRLIDRGADLVADDYTRIEAKDGRLHASAPGTIAGQIEMRGVGIVAGGDPAEGPVALLLDLDGEPERLPPDRLPETLLCGIGIPTLAFRAFEASAAIKAERALALYGREATS